jgi:pimeloyl-ACP methyl ester carboxylesterase
VTGLPPVQRLPWHGRELAVRRGGSGPTVVLIHGMAGSLATWDPVFPALAECCDVVAVDLPGHGASARLRGDFSLGALASAVRDVLEVLDIDGATIVGHSLGGGIAMQFAYQFPERTERLVLVSSGGLGRDVTPLLRLLTVPGAELALAALTRLQQHPRVSALGQRLRPFAGRVWNDLPYMTRQMATLADPHTRASFLGTVRAVIDIAGQTVSATDRLYLAQHLPTLIIWGARDRMIPVAHGVAAAEVIPGSRLELVPDAGHYPHEDEPERVARSLVDFVTTTPAARLTSGEIARLHLGDQLRRQA